MLESFFSTVLSVLPGLISAATLAIVSWMSKRFMQFHKEHMILLNSQRSQLKADIVCIYEKAKARGYITHMELETLNLMADSYFALDGNHYIHNVVDRANKMPVGGEKIPLN